MGVILFILFIVLTVGDVLTTKKALEDGHVEANPVVEWIMEKTGKYWWLSKVIPITAFYFLVTEGHFKTAFVLNLFYLLAVYHNYRVIKGE